MYKKWSLWKASYNLSDTKEAMLKDSVQAGIMYDQNLDEDIKSLRWTILYDLKGISAYAHQARFIGYHTMNIQNLINIVIW